MKNLQKLKGRLTYIDPDFAYVIEDKTDIEYRFYASDVQDIEEGEKVDLLIEPAMGGNLVSKILSLKKTKKIKPIKLPNFSILIGHMIKVKDRLQATLELSGSDSDLDDIKEKIQWLERGISLFR